MCTPESVGVAFREPDVVELPLIFENQKVLHLLFNRNTTIYACGLE
jgi:hypothetical protein